MEDGWYILRDGVERAPVDWDTLEAMAKSGELFATDMLRIQGTDRWMQAGKIRDLKLELIESAVAVSEVEPKLAYYAGPNPEAGESAEKEDYYTRLSYYADAIMFCAMMQPVVLILALLFGGGVGLPVLLLLVIATLFIAFQLGRRLFGLGVALLAMLACVIPIIGFFVMKLMSTKASKILEKRSPANTTRSKTMATPVLTAAPVVHVDQHSSVFDPGPATSTDSIPNIEVSRKKHD